MGWRKIGAGIRGRPDSETPRFPDSPRREKRQSRSTRQNRPKRQRLPPSGQKYGESAAGQETPSNLRFQEFAQFSKIRINLYKLILSENYFFS